MMTVHEVSGLTGVSIRTLQYYDRIGLLRPAGHTEAGYRLYDGAALETLQQILLFEVGFVVLFVVQYLLLVPVWFLDFLLLLYPYLFQRFGLYL